MKTIKTTTDNSIKTSTVTSTPDPPDITTALDLREQLSAFNALAPHRSVFESADTEALARITGQADAFRRASCSAAIAAVNGSVGEQIRSRAEHLGASIGRYLKLTSAKRDEIVEGLQIVTPAIESGSFRAALHRTGDETLASIDAYLAMRRQQVSDDGNRAKHEADILSALRKCDVTRGLIDAAFFGFRAEREYPVALVARNVARFAIQSLISVVAVNPDLVARLEIPEGNYGVHLEQMLRTEFETATSRNASAVAAA